MGIFRNQHGPGKASSEKPVTGFTFNDGEVFCEETAIMYIPKIQYLLVQYNHHGVRIGKIQDYMNTYNNHDAYSFEFRPKFDETTERKFTNRAATKKLTFSIDPRFLNDKDRVSGTALGHALDLGKSSDGEVVELTIRAGQGKSKWLNQFIDKTAEVLKKKSVENPDGIKKLEVGILSNLDSKMEVIDLIEERLVKSFSDIKLGADLRYPRQERYRMLERAYNGWKNILKP
jgi:hypothetical protein